MAAGTIKFPVRPVLLTIMHLALGESIGLHYGLPLSLLQIAGCDGGSRRYPMEPKKFTLCPACTACPEVEITDQGVTIGERENTVRLSHAEWNQVVRRIKSGELNEV